MVSLISPASSDIEDIPEIPEEPIKSRASSPLKSLSITRTEEAVPKTSSLRKIVKQGEEKLCSDDIKAQYIAIFTEDIEKPHVKFLDIP